VDKLAYILRDVGFVSMF